MSCGLRRTAVGCLFALSFVNLFILLPVVVVFVRDSRPAAGERTFLSAAEQTSLRLPPFSDAAVQGWRRVRDRRGQSDIKWSRRILRNVWCNPASTASRPAWNSSVAEVLALVVGRTQLDRHIATIACIQACDEARLQWVADASADTALPDEMSYRCERHVAIAGRARAHCGRRQQLVSLVHAPPPPSFAVRTISCVVRVSASAREA